MASDSRQRVLNAIIGYITEHQYPPTIREICDMTGLKSPSTVQIHISNLIRDGLLETDHEYGASRALRVTGFRLTQDGKQIPVKPMISYDDRVKEEWCSCGVCAHAFGWKRNVHYNYCPNCGRAVDWSD